MSSDEYASDSSSEQIDPKASPARPPSCDNNNVIDLEKSLTEIERCVYCIRFELRKRASFSSYMLEKSNAIRRINGYMINDIECGKERGQFK
jgi:hypothetical protein